MGGGALGQREREGEREKWGRVSARDKPICDAKGPHSPLYIRVTE